MSWDAPYPEWPLKKPKNPTALTYDADNPPQDVALPAQDTATPYAPTGITGLAPNDYGIPNLFGTPNTVPQGTLNNGSEPGSPEPYNPNSGIITDTNTYQEYANAPQQTLNNGSEPAVDPRSPENQAVEDSAAPTGVFGLPITPAQPAQQPAAQAAPTGPSPEVVSGLTNQILGQGLTSKWQGEGHGSAEKNAADMARIMASIGITDIKQFGEVPKLEQATIREGYNGQVAQQDDSGYYVMSPPDADGNRSRINVDPSQLTKAYGYQDADGNFVTVDPSKVVEKNGMALVETGKTYGNKLTGQEVPMTYSERQTGNAWGGTFAGKDNTGYRVQFGPDGTPYFYTTKSSSNDLANIMADMGPLGQIALAAATGGLSLPAQLAANAAVQLLAGGNLKDVAKGTALSYLGGQAGNLISGSQGITDFLGKTGTDIAARTAQQFVGSGGQADLGKALLGSAVGTGVNSAIDQVPGMENLSPADKNMASSILAAAATGVPIDQAIQNAVVGRASSAASNAVAQSRANEESTPSKFNFNDFFPSTNNQTANPATVNQQPPEYNIDELLASIQPKTADEDKTDLGPGNKEIEKLLGIDEDTTGDLINKAATDTLVNKDAGQPAGKDKVMEDDFGTGGDYMGNLSSLFSPNDMTAQDYDDQAGLKNIEDLLANTSAGNQSNAVDESFLDNLSPSERARYEATKDGINNTPEYGVQDSGVSQAMMDEFNKNFNPAGGFSSQWQTVGTNRVMVNDDGTSTILDPTTGQTSYLDEDQTKALIKNGTLNSSKSGYVGATGGTGTTPGGSKAGSAATKAAAAKTTAASPGTNNNNLIMALMAMMAMMNSKGSGSSSGSSYIPALQANRSQLPYAPTGRPGAGGVNYFSPTTYTAKAAEGGLMGLAAGGMSSLGGYSDGGRLLRGPGDGVSDSIPATIGGRQPARLAEGEFVVPARIVSELGNGSTNAGANKLYEMMDRVQNARRKTKNVAADTKAHKYLPS